MFTKKKNEILDLKHKRNVSFLEARKTEGCDTRENSYASFAQKADTIKKDNRYRTLWEKLIELEANNWSNFRST